MTVKQFYRYVFVFLLSVFVFTGCGGNGSSSNNEDNLTQQEESQEQNLTQQEENLTKTVGYFIDSPIEGATYLCDGHEALTNSEGKFECLKAPVTFKVGGLTLGTLTAFTADGKVYPQDLVGVARDSYLDKKLKLLVRLIQSLDDDGDIETKITITEEVRDALIDEQNLTDMSEDEIETLLSNIDKNIVKECGALKHLGDSSLNCNRDGSYYVYVAPVGGGSGSSTEVVPDDTKTEVNINVQGLDIKLDENYSIVTEDTSILISTSTPMNIEVSKEDITPVILSNQYGEPIF